MTPSSYQNNDTNNEDDTIQIGIKQSLKVEYLSLPSPSVASRKKTVAMAVAVTISVFAFAGGGHLGGRNLTPWTDCRGKGDKSCRLGDACHNNNDCPLAGRSGQSCCVYWLFGVNTCGAIDDCATTVCMGGYDHEHEGCKK